MNSRGIASAARRLGFALLIIACLTTLVTLCWGKIGAPVTYRPRLLGPSVRPSDLLASTRSRDTGTIGLNAAPYIAPFPGDDTSYAAPHVTPRTASPGDIVKVEVNIQYQWAGNSSVVNHVWLQIKNPDPRIICGTDNIYGTAANDYKNTTPNDPTLTAQDVPTTYPTEFHTYYPSGSAADPSKAES
ncbi:MAG TPA: hypothetical protein VGM23_09405, partial [Armatimonadota bacterium]